MSGPDTSRRANVVRGTARRVVIVPQGEEGPFEEAIFIVRGSSALSEGELMRQAMEAAGAESAPPRAKLRRGGLRRALPWLLTGAVGLTGALAAVIIL